MTTATSSLPVYTKVLAMTLGLAAFAGALVIFLAAVGVALNFRSGGADEVRTPMWMAAACLVGLPWVWAAVSRKDRPWPIACIMRSKPPESVWVRPTCAVTALRTAGSHRSH